MVKRCKILQDLIDFVDGTFIQKCSLSGSKLSGNTELLLEIQKNKTDPGNKHFLFCHVAIDLSQIPF